MNIEKLGKNIRKFRIENNLSQEYLANKLFISRQAISMWEKGICMPNYEMILSLANIFNITTEELLTGKINDNLKVIKEKRDIKIDINIKPTININFSLINININKRRIR